MYQGPAGSINREEYLLGRPIDKYVLGKQEEDAGPSAETGLLPGSIFSATGAISALDMAAKIREDPLFAIRKREEEKKKEVLNNPVKMKKIREFLEYNLNKKEKKRKKEKKKKHKKSRHHSSSTEESSSGDERCREKSHKKRESPPATSVIQRHAGYGLQVRNSESSKQQHYMPSKQETAPVKYKAHSRSPLKHSSKNSRHSDSRASRSRSSSPSPSRYKKHERADKREEIKRSPSPKQVFKRRPNASYTKKMTQEELEQKRREMMENAKQREEERSENVRRYKREEEREKEIEKHETKEGKFLHKLKLESAASSCVEDRVKRNIHSIQRTNADMEKFMKR
ncbi:pre-mRNA-splicing factor CWC25 homolog isoform X2 [Protopterus annectens]|nr:pre-mRNA-splicing factor CWC25 homolog isoform X2 [Protopterus annectens]